MGQQQILLLLLGICVIGIALSVGIITFQNENAPDNRQQLIDELEHLAFVAQEYNRRPFHLEGGEGTFLGIGASVTGIRKLTLNPSTAVGDFFVKRSGDVTSLELMAVGIERGVDPRFPVRVAMTVFADRTEIQVLN